ncbi:ESPL1 protein, partial [Smithornis capensis]|nr:ESPL1 protein [Smithornis capensis]
ALCKSLDEAFSLWKQLLESPGIPSVRSLEQTVTSLQLLATLYQLLAKVIPLEWLSLDPQGAFWDVTRAFPASQPIPALESFLLLRSLCRRLGDIPGTAGALSQLSRLLFQLECPTHAQVSLGMTLGMSPE